MVWKVKPALWDWVHCMFKEIHDSLTMAGNNQANQTMLSKTFISMLKCINHQPYDLELNHLSKQLFSQFK